mmetsp:Transcript_29938/g.34319  ORF Transcript_29938/g.34319 Transcript_29938/m.34319 type:complete len:114 (-) Transcript_29938:268-609(-)
MIRRMFLHSVTTLRRNKVFPLKDNTVEYLSFGSSTNVRRFHKKEAEEEGVEGDGAVEGEGEGEDTVNGVEGREREEDNNDLFVSLSSSTILLLLLSRMKDFSSHLTSSWNELN